MWRTNNSSDLSKVTENTKCEVFLVFDRYSILSRYYSELSDDSLGDTPVPMPNTEVKPRTPEVVGGCPL